MREQELQQLEENVRSMEQMNLNITEKLNDAHVANNTTYTYELFVFLFFFFQRPLLYVWTGVRSSPNSFPTMVQQASRIILFSLSTWVNWRSAATGVIEHSKNCSVSSAQRMQSSFIRWNRSIRSEYTSASDHRRWRCKFSELSSLSIRSERMIRYDHFRIFFRPWLVCTSKVPIWTSNLLQCWTKKKRIVLISRDRRGSIPLVWNKHFAKAE